MPPTVFSPSRFILSRFLFNNLEEVVNAAAADDDDSVDAERFNEIAGGKGEREEEDDSSDNDCSLPFSLSSSPSSSLVFC